VGQRSRSVGGFELPEHALDDAIFGAGRPHRQGRSRPQVIGTSIGAEDDAPTGFGVPTPIEDADDVRDLSRRELGRFRRMRAEFRVRRLAASEAAPSEAACCDTRHGRAPGSRSVRTRGSRRAGSGSRASPGGSDSDDGEPEPPLAAANDQAARAALAHRGAIHPVPRSASRCGRREGRAS
jgi:hypothetical protein